MIHDFEDFCTYVFVIVDDIMQELGPILKRPGPAPECSDSELITMTLVGECRGWDVETELLSNMQEHTGLFPCLPSQSRFNRRRRNLMFVINLIRRTILGWLDLAQDRQCLIDSLPIPVVQFYLVPGSTGDWKAHGARFGKVPSKNQTIFGYKLHLLVTLGGVILDFELAPANLTDLTVGFELLLQHTDLDVLGGKGEASIPEHADNWAFSGHPTANICGFRADTLDRSGLDARPTGFGAEFHGLLSASPAANRTALHIAVWAPIHPLPRTGSLCDTKISQRATGQST